jgi:hypothetical protein
MINLIQVPGIIKTKLIGTFINIPIGSVTLIWDLRRVKKMVVSGSSTTDVRSYCELVTFYTLIPGTMHSKIANMTMCVTGLC